MHTYIHYTHTYRSWLQRRGDRIWCLERANRSLMRSLSSYIHAYIHTYIHTLHTYIQVMVAEKRRPHLVFGTRELELNEMPVVLRALCDDEFSMYHPGNTHVYSLSLSLSLVHTRKTIIMLPCVIMNSACINQVICMHALALLYIREQTHCSVG
jgi:hypothetical protein